MRIVGISGKQYPELCILSEKEIGIGTIASYSPIDNRIYVTRTLADPKRTVQMQQASGILLVLSTKIVQCSMKYSITKMRWNIERMAAKSKIKMITLST